MDTTSKIIKYSLLVIGAVLFANVLMLDFFFVSQRGTILDLQTRISQISDNTKMLGGLISNTQTPSIETVTIPEQTSCPQTCVSLINAVKTTAPTVAPVVTQSAPISRGGEYFVPMGSGSVLSTEATSSNWKTIEGAQATFDSSSYGTIKAAYFETFIHVATNGEVHTRLFDTTTPSVFFGSDKSTNQTVSTFVSIPVILTAGSKTYKVQMYSSQSTGTLDQARIRIVVQ